jgi:hypothetical protein
MNQDQKNLQVALEKIEILNLEKKHLKRQIDTLNEKIYQLENPSLYNENKGLGVSINRLIKDADSAMKKYTNKLRKEGLKYAKQKQSKG